jgi:hypothetical protein
VRTLREAVIAAKASIASSMSSTQTRRSASKIRAMTKPIAISCTKARTEAMSTSFSRSSRWRHESSSATATSARAAPTLTKVNWPSSITRATPPAAAAGAARATVRLVPVPRHALARRTVVGLAPVGRALREPVVGSALRSSDVRRPLAKSRVRSSAGSSSMSGSGPCSTTRPSTSSRPRSPMRRACERSCVTKTNVRSVWPREILQELLDATAGGGVERGRGLVEQQDLGLVGQRSRQRDALRLAARELVDGLGGEVGRQADALEQRAGRLAPPGSPLGHSWRRRGP